MAPRETQSKAIGIILFPGPRTLLELPTVPFQLGVLRNKDVRGTFVLHCVCTTLRINVESASWPWETAANLANGLILEGTHCGSLGD